MIRVLIAKPGLDGHDRGAKVVAAALRDAGMEVIYTGLRTTPEIIVNTAIQESVDVIGLSILSGAHNGICKRIIELLTNAQVNIPVIIGGVIPPQEHKLLFDIGIRGVYGQETTLAQLVEAVKVIVEKENLTADSESDIIINKPKENTMSEFRLPTLYCHSKKGKVKQWDINVVMRQFVRQGASVAEPEALDFAVIQTEHGYVDGKKQLAEVEVTEGKNVGKANETTIWAQACSEAESKWKKQIDKGYTEVQLGEVEEGEEQNEGEYPLPMLAKEYLDYLHDVQFPVRVQPKLNGIRGRSGIINGSFAMWSRKAKLYPVMMERFEAVLVPLLKKLNEKYPNAHLDGEFYSHGIPLQTINSGVKKKNEITERLGYHIYDIAEPSLEQFERDGIREELLSGLDSTIVVYVPSVECNSDEEVQKVLKDCRAHNYEGAIVRRKSGVESKYLNRHRSDGLLKLKEFHDKEYRIIGGKEGKGKFKGSVIFRCITEDGKEFDVTPTGNMEERRSWFTELNTFIGKQITVRYQDLSTDGIPTILTGIDAAVIRDYE